MGGGTAAHDDRDPRDINLEQIRAEVDNRQLGEWALFIATMTALAESDLYRYSNPLYPLSSQAPNDGPPPARLAYTTKNSLGLYQQRPEWWGTGTVEAKVRQLMDARASTGLFLAYMTRHVPTWRTAESWWVAQSVQGSEFDGITVRNGKVLEFGANYRGRLAQTARVLAGGPRHFTDGGE